LFFKENNFNLGGENEEILVNFVIVGVDDGL
jgi:hypothetical protein